MNMVFAARVAGWRNCTDNPAPKRAPRQSKNLRELSDSMMSPWKICPSDVCSCMKRTALVPDRLYDMVCSQMDFPAAGAEMMVDVAPVPGLPSPMCSGGWFGACQGAGFCAMVVWATGSGMEDTYTVEPVVAVTVTSTDRSTALLTTA